MSITSTFHNFYNVQKALILREAITRHGDSYIGYAWAVLLPAILIGVMLLVFVQIGRSAPPGMSLEMMLFTGLLPWRLLIDVRSQVTSAFSANKALLYYSCIKPLDLVWARIILEFFTYLLTFILLSMVFWMFGFHVIPHDYLSVLFVLVLLAIGGASIGVIVAYVSIYFAFVKKIVGFVFQVMFFTSGIYFVIGEIPGKMRDILLLNPAAHAIDLLRGEYFVSYTAQYSSFSYLICWVFALFTLALMCDKVFRRKLLGANS